LPLPRSLPRRYDTAAFMIHLCDRRCRVPAPYIIKDLLVGFNPFGRGVMRVVRSVMSYIEKKGFFPHFTGLLNHTDRLVGIQPGYVSLFLHKMVIAMPGDIIAKFIPVGVGINLSAQVAVRTRIPVSQGTMPGEIPDMPFSADMGAVTRLLQTKRKQHILGLHIRG